MSDTCGPRIRLFLSAVVLVGGFALAIAGVVHMRCSEASSSTSLLGTALGFESAYALGVRRAFKLEQYSAQVTSAPQLYFALNRSTQSFLYTTGATALTIAYEFQQLSLPRSRFPLQVALLNPYEPLNTVVVNTSLTQVSLRVITCQLRGGCNVALLGVEQCTDVYENPHFVPVDPQVQMCQERATCGICQFTVSAVSVCTVLVPRVAPQDGLNTTAWSVASSAPQPIPGSNDTIPALRCPDALMTAFGSGRKNDTALSPNVTVTLIGSTAPVVQVQHLLAVNGTRSRLYGESFPVQADASCSNRGPGIAMIVFGIGFFCAGAGGVALFWQRGKESYTEVPASWRAVQ
jgi:hypothetical protein